MPREFLVGGAWRTSAETLELRFPYDNTLVDAVCMATERDLEDAIQAAERGFAVTRKLPSHARSGILSRLHRLMGERFADLVDALVMETGKARKIAQGEAARAMQTVLIASEEAKRIGGEILDLDWTPAGENHRGFARRFPIGIVLAITPFNYPLNLALHKLAPAIACGNSLILKPPEIAPLSSLLLAELILEAGLPPEALSVVPCPGARAERLVTDPRIAMLSFTGSVPIGWMLRDKAGRKKVALELGGTAPAIVHEDADLRLAVAKTSTGAFANAGQNCISVQRILLHRAIYEDFCDQFVPAVAALKVGDPRDEATDIGPMISPAAAARAKSWVDEAVQQGAHILYGGGEVHGAHFPPTILTEVEPSMKVCAQEVFAPVVTLSPYETWDDAVRLANASDFGLQAGVFTRDIGRAMDAWERLDMGGIAINDVSTFRVDQMPYGGMKASGMGREGIRYAIEDMTEIKLLIIHTP